MNNRTQSIVSDDLGMSEHIIHAETRGESLDMKTKEKADLLEGNLKICKHNSMFCKFVEKDNLFTLSSDFLDFYRLLLFVLSMFCKYAFKGMNNDLRYIWLYHVNKTYTFILTFTTEKNMLEF